MKYDEWEPMKRREENYRSELVRLLDRFKTFLDPLGITDPLQIMEALRAFFGTDAFGDLAVAAASRMATGLFHDNARTWKEAARESMRGKMIYRALQRELRGPVGAKLQAIVKENARLITSIPAVRIGRGMTLTEQVADYIKEQALKGRRASAIAEDIAQQLPNVAESRITLIARTEVSKASTALTRVRAEELGVNWYVWRATKDARLRKSHRLMDKVIVPWDDPPAPEDLVRIKSSLGHYHAGDCPNCRCYCQPLLRLETVDWPARVYYGDRIQSMTRRRFEQISGTEVSRAA